MPGRGSLTKTRVRAEIRGLALAGRLRATAGPGVSGPNGWGIGRGSRLAGDTWLAGGTAAGRAIIGAFPLEEPATGNAGEDQRCPQKQQGSRRVGLEDGDDNPQTLHASLLCIV